MKCLTSRRVCRFGIGLGIVLFALVPFSLYFTSQPAEAQCGSSASSCKNCHELQGQDPVNANGEWHVAHAFGDFCEFCHAGNVQAKAQDEAHIGLVDPLADIKASCQSCHPQDYEERAQVYASTLGVTLGAGGAGDSGSGAGDASTTLSGSSDVTATTTTTTTNATAATTNTSPGIGAPSGGEIINYQELYAESAASEETFTPGDKVLIVMIVVLFLALLVAIWFIEGIGTRLMRWWQQNMLIPASPTLQGATPGAGLVPMPSLGELADTPARRISPPADAMPPAPAELEDLFRRRPELSEVWPLLVRTDAKTLQALAVLLSQGEAGEVMQRLSKLNLAIVTALRELSPSDRALLLALVQER